MDRKLWKETPIVALALALSVLQALTGCLPGTGIESAAQVAFEGWAQEKGIPYRNMRYTVVSSDGTFARVRIAGEFRERPASDWETRESEVECRNVGGRWQCDRQMEFARSGGEQGAAAALATPVSPTVQPTETPTSPVPVPDLTGLTAEHAQARLAQFGLQYAEGNPRFDPYIQPGHVVSQEPRYGDVVRQGSAVVVFLGTEPVLARVPDVVQTSYEGAQLVLHQAGFRTLRKEAGCTDTPAGYIDRQDPRGGAEDIQGITVTLYVSVGDRTTMPDILRLPLDDALRRIEAAGLTFRYANGQTQADMPPGVDISSVGAPGQVISYQVNYGGLTRTNGELPAGSSLPCGATVDVAYYATTP